MNKMRKYLLLLIMSFAMPGFAQVTFFDFQVFEPLPSADLGAFMSANGLRNTQRLFLVTIAPAGVRVKLQGIINWKDVNSNSFDKPLLNFITREFDSRNFDNTDIGVSDVKIDKWNFTKENADELKDRGKAVGSFEFIVKLLLPDGTDYPGFQPIRRVMIFTNPAQTISIISPSADSKQDFTNVLAQWVPVVGVDEYLVKIGVRSNASQSLTEALNFGVPLADKSVGNETSVNLFALCDRPWERNQEIVFQVTGIIPGPGGGEKIYSNLVNFTFFTKDDQTFNETSSRSTKSSYSNDELKSLFGGMNDAEFQNFLNNCGEITEIIDQDGNVISKAELQRILDYLKQNPDSIIKISSILKKADTLKSEDVK